MKNLEKSLLLLIIVLFAQCNEVTKQPSPLTLQEEEEQPLSTIDSIKVISITKDSLHLALKPAIPQTVSAQTIIDQYEVQQVEPIYNLLFQKEKAIQKHRQLAKSYGLVNGARIIEIQKLTNNRMLLLWMTNFEPIINAPDEIPAWYNADKGHGYYKGQLFVSLVNQENVELLNTIPIVYDEIDHQADTLRQSYINSIPFAIWNPKYESLNTLFYMAEGGAKGVPGLAKIMHLQDYNGNGNSHEFALYKFLGVMDHKATLIGYSERLDKVIQYNIDFEITDSMISNQQKQLIRKVGTQKWGLNLFSTLHKGKLTYQFDVDYRGRGGQMYTTEVVFDTIQERFNLLKKVQL